MSLALVWNVLNDPSSISFFKLVRSFGSLDGPVTACGRTRTDSRYIGRYNLFEHCSKFYLSWRLLKVQHRAHAKIVAESDTRNALSIHALVVAYCTHLKSTMIENFDATQSLVSQESPDTGFFIRQESVDEVTSLTSESRGGFVFAKKYYHVNNAAGTTAAPAFNIANPSVVEREFVV
jgi:hypothetical protein